MLGLNAGTAYIAVRPMLRGFSSSVNAQMRTTDRTFASAGLRAGQTYHRSFGRRLLGGLGTIAKRGAVTIGTIGVLGGAAIAKSAIQLEQEFSSTMNQIGAVADVPKRQLRTLSDLAMRMGADTVFSANEASQAMLELAKGGMSAATIRAGGLKGTLTLAAAGGTDMATAAMIASDALNVFNLRGGQMKMVASALAGGANASSASIESLGLALSQAGLTAKDAGLSVQETVATLAAFDNAGLKGSDAGTSLKTMLTRLTPASEKAEDAMEKYNLQFVNADGSMKNIRDVAEQLQNKLGGLSQAERNAALNTIFGSDARRAAIALMNEGGDGLAKYIKKTSDLGAAQRVADSRMRGTSGAIEKMKGSLETAGLALGVALRPATIAIANMVSNIAEKAIPHIQRFGKWLRGAMGGEGANIFERVGRWVSGLLPKLKKMGPDAKKSFGTIGPALLDAKRELPSFTDLLSVSGTVLSFLADHADLLAKALPYLAAGFLVVKTAQVAGNAAAAVAVPLRIAEMVANRRLAASNNALVTAIRSQTGATRAATASELTKTGAQNASTGASIRSRLATIGKTIAERASAAASRAMAAATWLVNAALRANPIGIIITALLALGAGLVLAYKKSETFRNIVNKAWGGIKAAAMAVWGWLKRNFVPFFTETIPRAFRAVVGFIKKHWAKILPIVLGPLGLLIVAVVKNWDKIKAAIRFAWQRWIRPALRAIGDFITGTLIPILRRFWNNVVKPVWAAIGRFVRATWNNVIKPALRAIWAFIRNVLWPGIKWFWNNVIKPYWRLIGAAIRVAWNNVIKPVFRALWAFIRNVVVPVIRWLWNNVVRPVFRFIGAAIKFAWNSVIKPAFASMKAFITNVVVPVIRWLWKNVIRPAFRSIGETIKFAWTRIIKPVFSALGGFIKDKVVPAFKRGVDAIGNAWDRIKRLAMVPVNFVIDTVYNNGIRKFVNGILEKLGTDLRLPYVQPIGQRMTGGRSTGRRPGLQRAAGGVLPGYTPRRDVHQFYSPTGGWLGLSGGEAIMVPEWTRAIGGPKEVARRNAWARRHPHARLERGQTAFAGGGTMPVPGSGNQHSRSEYPWASYAGDFPVPLGTPVRAYQAGRVAFTKRLATSYGNHIGLNHASGVSTLYAHLSRILVHAGQVVREAQVIGRSGSTGNSTGPHLHFEIQGAPFAPGGDQGGGGIFSWLVRKAVGWLADKGRALLDKIPGQDTIFGSAAVGAGKKIISGIENYILSNFGGEGSTGPIPTGPVVEVVRKIAGRYGWDSGAQWAALRELVQRESSWNPNAQNPTSTAYGLFQFLDSTWAGVGGRKTSNPGLQAIYGLRYIKGRYGSPIGAVRFHDANNWYRHGGVVEFDNGGWLDPDRWRRRRDGTPVNRTRKPEPVFTHQQWQTLKKAITALTLNEGRQINLPWLRRALDPVVKDAGRLRAEFIRARDAMRGFRTRTERARRTLERIQSTDRFERRQAELAKAEKAFKATRSGEAIGEDIAETRREARRALRRARRTPMARDALRDYHKAERALEKKRTTDQIEQQERRVKWRRAEAREALRAANAPVTEARKAYKKAQDEAEKAKSKEDKQEARRRVRRAREALEAARKREETPAERRAKKQVARTTRRLKNLKDERAEVEKLTKQRDRAGRQSDAVAALVDARKNLEALREERKERRRLRREYRRAGRADILQREEKAQERLNRRIEAEKAARDRANKAAKAYRAAQQAALERARTIKAAGIELGGIGATETKTGGALLANLRQSVRTVRVWGTVVRNLIGAGLRGPILDEFIDAGPSAEAVRLGKSLLTGGRIGEINRLQDQLKAASIRAGAIGAAYYSPAQTAAIRRATPVQYQPGQTKTAGGVTVTYAGMPADTVDTIVHKTTNRVIYELDRRAVV